MIRPLAAIAAALALASPALAQDHSAHGDDPAAKAYADAAAQMHAAMSQPLTGDPDIDFARGMIPHHEAAIAMAETVIAYGSDPTLHAMAAEIVAAQTAEIATLRAWLAENDK